MKKICFVTTISGTIRSFILKTAIYLHENTDWDISFICSYDSEFEKELPEYIHYYPVTMERGISIGGIKAMFEMKKIFKKEKFDMIQYSTPNASLYASLAGFLARIPVRLYCQWGMAYVGFSGLKRSIFKFIEKTVCFLSTWIEPDSYSNLYFAHQEKLYSKNKGSVIWNGSACGIDLNKFDCSHFNEYRKEIREKLSINETDFVYGFVGRITRDKGINELFEASKKILNENSNMKLILVGSEEIDKTVNEELYQWSKNNSDVIYCGRTNEVEKYLSAMDCYILPSYREGFGMGTIEAEAMGVPVIVTNIPGPIDAMKKDETGYIVEKKDVNSLYLAMKKIYENEEDRIKFKNKSVDFVKENFEQNQLFNYIKKDREKLLKRGG
jgi:glycosyltransferase involved in cell wall biosynthesis